MFKITALIVGAVAFSATANAADNLIFRENFDGASDVFESGSWVKSGNAKYNDQPVLIKPPTRTISGFENDKGVQLTQEMKHYGFGAKFLLPLTLTEDEIVIQYELKLEERLDCGGAYIKLLRDSDVSLENLSNETPYSIMFGPDKCGSDSRVHMILQFRNPVTQEWSEHHYDGVIKPKMDRGYHLYTLAIKKDNTFEVLIDTKSVARGNLLDDLTPPINPPKEINDPRDFKPSTWADETHIVDPAAVKPVDWDDSQPKKILATKQTKPASWDESAPETIPDPDAIKPDGWDDEEDGEWEAPQVANPACEKTGCGPWSPPLVSNPLYRGKWTPPKIPNPKYKGVWKPKKILNDAYFYEANPYIHLPAAYGVAVEVWTISAGILYDNFHIGHSLADALEYGRATTFPKSRVERELNKIAQREEEYLDKLELLESGTLRERLIVRAEMVVEYFKHNPTVPLYAAIALVLTMMYFLIFDWKVEKPGEKKKAAGKVAQKVERALETLIDEVKAEADEVAEEVVEEEESSAALESKSND